MDREQRQKELEGLEWHEVKAIAESLNLAKPDGGWKDAIPQILDLEAEQDLVHEVSSAVTKDEHGVPLGHEVSVEADPDSLPQTLYPQSFYAAAKIPHCSKCGEKRRTNDTGLFCPTDQNDCPMLRA